MRRHTRTGLLGLLGLVLVSVAWSGASPGMTLQPQSRLWVEGTSTVRGYDCTAQKFDARVETNRPNAVSAVLAGEKAVTTVELTVTANQLDCANGTMNTHMLRALKASEHPEISFRLSSYELAQASEGTQVTLTGTLSLGGTQKPVTLNALAQEASNGTLRIVGSHEIRMTEFGLRPPTLMMGTLRVNERVQVNFDLVLRA
jgi:polyisoprenoid-binding protein YceI